MIKWANLSSEERRYVLRNASNPLGVMIGIPEARRRAEQELGPRNTWEISVKEVSRQSKQTK